MKAIEVKRGNNSKLALFLRCTGWLGVSLMSCAVGGAISPASAQSAVWTGAISSDWNDAANWSTGVVPSNNTTTIRLNNVVASNPVLFQGPVISQGSTLYLGEASGETGHLVIEAGAQLQLAGTANIGYLGTGSLVIRNATLIGGGSAKIAFLPGSSGAVVLSGPNASWNNIGGYIDVADYGTGSFRIEAGAKAITTTGYVADHSGTGNLTITDHDSKLDHDRNIRHGRR